MLKSTITVDGIDDGNAINQQKSGFYGLKNFGKQCHH